MPRSTASSEQAELMIPVPPMNKTRMALGVREHAPVVNGEARAAFGVPRFHPLGACLMRGPKEA